MKNQKNIFIIIGIIVVVTLGVALAVVLINNDDKKMAGGNGSNTSGEKAPNVPASNTEELKENLKIAAVTKVTKDKIIFDETSAVKEGDKVAVWVYSEPKFLGYFKVKVVDGQKVLDGLQEKLKSLNLESGKHNIALSTESGASLGYVNIIVEESGTMQEGEVDKTVTKEVAEQQVIDYKTEVKYVTSRPSGNIQVIQAGVNGLKEVKYEVVYDENGVELSRKIINETVLKEPVTKIEERGKADFNLNTTKVQNERNGFVCPESDLYDESGCMGLDDMQYRAIKVNGTYYAICATNCSKIGFNKPVKITPNGNLYTAIINGTTYYFDSRSGGFTEELLTEADCKTFGLSCGRW